MSGRKEKTQKTEKPPNQKFKLGKFCRLGRGTPSPLKIECKSHRAPLKSSRPVPAKQSPIGNRQSTMLPMDGVLVIDKPAGLTSHDVVARVRHILHERRVGHTGTLDPFATGVLVVVVGRATRLAQFLSGAEKEYDAIIRLGFATDTGDVTGDRLTYPDEGEDTTSSGPWSEPEVEAALASLRG